MTTATKTQATPAEVVEGEFRGIRMLIINPSDRFPFQFGLKKAKLILDNLEAIRAFVEKHGS